MFPSVVSTTGTGGGLAGRGPRRSREAVGRQSSRDGHGRNGAFAEHLVRAGSDRRCRSRRQEPSPGAAGRNPIARVRTLGARWRCGPRIQCLCIDTTDPSRLASFWQSALGWRRTYEGDNEVVREPPAGTPEDGVAPDLLFLRVPEDKLGKNRLLLDLRPQDQAAEVARLERLGAHRTNVGQGADASWVVMADPDGNEFDVLRPLTPEQLSAG